MYHFTVVKNGPLSDRQYIMYHSDHWLNLRQLWTNWPDREMRGLFKWYYLVQFAFWVQQIVVVHIEKRRKDHWQMFTHHVITCILMFTSYGYHQSKVGNTILCLMDAVDILFAVSRRPAMFTLSGYAEWNLHSLPNYSNTLNSKPLATSHSASSCSSGSQRGTSCICSFAGQSTRISRRKLRMDAIVAPTPTLKAPAMCPMTSITSSNLSTIRKALSAGTTASSGLSLQRC